MKNIYLILMIVIVSSCSKGGDDRLAEQEGIKAREQLQAENANQRQWADKMEEDLNRRKNFFKAIEGEFEGDVEVENIQFSIAAKFIPSIPIEFYNRTRTLDEINYEIQNLNLNLNIKIENPRAANSAVSCTIEDYKPDYNNGQIYVISEACKNIFHLILTDDLSNIPLVESRSRARTIARDVISGGATSIEFLDGVFESSVSSKKYRFKMKRSL